VRSFALFAVAGMLMPACLRAVPLDPDERRIFVNDGDTLVLQDLGDEYFSVTRTEDGYLVVTGSNGVLYYADESGEPSVFKAKSEKDRTGLERAFLGALDREKAFEAHRRKFMEELPDSNGDMRAYAPGAPSHKPACRHWNREALP